MAKFQWPFQYHPITNDKSEKTSSVGNATSVRKKGITFNILLIPENYRMLLVNYRHYILYPYF